MKKALTIFTLILLLSVFGFTQNLATVINALGARESTLTIFKQYAVTNNLTVPANITLEFLQGGSVLISTTKTLTINGHVEAGLYTIFEWAGTGKVVWGDGSVREVYPQWWGAKGDGATDDSAAIQVAVDSLLTSGGVVYFPTGDYELETTIDLTNINPDNSVVPDATIVIRGSGSATTRFLGGEENFGFFELIGSNWLTLEGFTIYANREANHPDFGISAGRKTGNASSGQHFFNDIKINNRFSKTAFFTLSSEGNVFKRIYINVYAGNGLVLAKNNLQWNIPIKYQAFGTGVGGNGTSSIKDLRIYHIGNQPTEFLLAIEYAQTLSVHNFYAYSKYLDYQISIGKACEGITFKNLQTEYMTNEPDAGIIFQGVQDADNADYRDVSFEGCRMFGIYGAAGSKITGVRFANSHWRGTTNLVVDVDRIYDSIFDQAMNLANVTTIHNPVYRARTTEINVRWLGYRKGAASPEEVSYVGEIQIESAPVSGDNIGQICINRQDTQMRVQANAAAVIMEVDATAGMLAGDVIGITLDNYPAYTSVHWTTIGSITDGDTLVIAVGIPGGRNAPVNADVYAMRWEDYGNIELGGSLAWDPANLIDGAGETSGAITVTGAALGDAVMVFPPYDMQDCIVYGYVQAANVVEIRIQNESTGARDFGNATWKVKVYKY